MEKKEIPSLWKLYTRDSPGAVFVFHMPTTIKCPPDRNTAFSNDQKYLLDDYCPEAKETDLELEYRSISSFRILALFQKKVSVCASKYEYPPKELLQHWADKLHSGEPVQIRETGLDDDDAQHFVYFPLEKLPKNVHAVDPDVLYELNSKRFLGTIDCEQAAILERPEYPCVLKVCRSNMGQGTWVIHSKAEYQKRMATIARMMPHADVVLNQYVRNIVHNYATHVYVNKEGDVTWIGAAEQRMTQQGHWDGVVYYHDDQAKIRKAVMPTLKPVIEAIHHKGYFGYVSIDVLIDDKDKNYVIDLNPRWGGCSVAILGTHVFAGRGYKVAIQALKIRLQGPQTRVLESVKQVKGGEVLVTAACGSDTVLCELTIFAPTHEGCHSILKEVQAKCG